jgi:hypothetical protein
VIDPWTSHVDALEDGPPFAGRMALLAGAFGVTVGVVTVAAALAGASWCRARLSWRAR